MKGRSLLFLLVLLCCPAMWGKSVVLNLVGGTRVYYKLSSDNPPVMVFADDGSLSVNGTAYAVADVESFEYTTTDYSGESGTVDAVVGLTDEGIDGPHSVYTLDGRLVGTDIKTLPAGAYVVRTKTATAKIIKR